MPSRRSTLRHRFTLFPLALLATMLALPLRSPAQTPSADPQMLGLREPTVEEQERMRVLAPRAVKVLANARALKLANDERLVLGLAPLALPVVPEGDEFLFAPATAASGAPGFDPTPPPTAAAEAAIPSAVDNSTTNFFPPIRSQGEIGSCACFSAAYYMSTFMRAQARGLNVRNAGDTDKLSPKFIYPFVNRGVDGGSWFTDVFEVLLKHGAPTWSVYPYSGVNTPSSYLEWPTTSAVWLNAIPNRMATSYTLTEIDTPAGLDRFKTALANGSVVVFATNVNGWDYAPAGDDPATPLDNALVGRPVAKVMRIHQSGHAMTIVGYNDNLWIDLNKNGRVDAGEKGALRIANSWGTGWQDGGFVWVAYDALRVTSAVAGVGTDISANRAGSTGGQKPFWDSTVYGLTARASYTPQLLGEFTIKGVTARNELRVTLGRGTATAPGPDTIFTPGALISQGGTFGFRGTAAAVDGTFVFDFSDLRQTGTSRYFLTIRDTASGDIATLDTFRLLDGQGNPVATAATGVPVTVDNSTANAFHAFTVSTATPAITSPLAAGGTVNAAFTHVIVATNSPTAFTATNLPSGLVLNPATGAIAGTPLAAGAFSVPIGATNGVGTDNRTLVITIASAVAPPVINSTATVGGTRGSPFNYQITATNSPTSFGVNGALPNGIALNPATGLITGTPAEAGLFNVQLLANNAGGTGTRALAINLVAPLALLPVINSATTAAVDAGNLFNYRIQATNNPTSFGATNLPTGLAVDSATGTITGRVSLARSYTITLTATNALGTGFGTLTLDVRGNSSFGPANDNFSNRIVLSGAAVATTGGNANANAEAGEPAHAGSAAATSVWWSWTAPSSGTLTVSTAGSAPLMRSALYTGASVSALTSFAPTAAGASTFIVIAGTVYHLAVDSIGNNTGAIALALSLSAPAPSRPANDNFAAAAILSGASATTNAITNAATAEAGEPAHGDTAAAKSTWYRWTAPAAGRAVVATRGSDFDTMLSIYTGAALNALTVVVRDDDSGGNLTSEASFNATAGTTYHFAVDGYAGAAGNLALSLALGAGATGPANDNFAGATVIAGATASLSGSTASATREAGEPAHAGVPAARSVWFRWVAPSAGPVTLSTLGSAFDTVLAVYTGSAVGALASVASNDDGGANATSLVTFNAIAGTTYAFAIDGYDGESGSYTLSLASLTTTNNAFASAATLTAGVRASALSTAATAEPGEPAHFTDNPAAKSVWWRWTATATGFVSLSTAGSSFDTVLAVYSGTALASLTRLAENDDAAGDDFTSTIFIRAVAGRTYLIAVDGFSGEAGTVMLTLTPSTDASTVYATDFERFTTGTGELVNQDQWSQLSAPSTGNAQGVLAQGIVGQGRAGYLGYGAPAFANATSTDVFVFRPLNFDPVAEAAPIVQVRADIVIVASTNGRNDVFRLSLYSRDGTLLGGFYFNTATRLVSTSDGANLAPTTFTFAFNTRYTLLGTFNFATRRWTARINATELVADSAFAVGATTVDVGDFDFVWRIADAQRLTGDNFIVFDNFAVTADAVPAAVPAVLLPATPPVGSVATPVSYAVTATNGPITGFSATGLPAGLTINAVTGLVSGTPTQAGTFAASFTATNARGQGAASSATFTIVAGPPVINSAATASARIGQPFAFQITATNAPRAFGLRGTAALPSGLTLNPTNGMISGTPAVLGTYRLTVAADNAVGSGTAALDLAIDGADTSRLVNLSVRSSAGTGAQTLIVGFSISGTGAKQMLIRGVGPTLTTFGVPGVLADPLLQLFNSSSVQIDQNNDWGGTAALTSAFTAVGAFALPAASRDAALLVPLAVANYSAQIVTTASGVVLVEGYDADTGSSATRLSNLSVRSVAGTDANILIVGFAISGTSSKSLLIRGVGPTLGVFGVTGVLADPQLRLFNSGGTQINLNDDWGGTAALSSAFTSVGAFALGATSKDAALVVSLAPGSYTAQVSGVGGTTGVALVEVYELP